MESHDGNVLIWQQITFSAIVDLLLLLAVLATANGIFYFRASYTKFAMFLMT